VAAGAKDLPHKRCDGEGEEKAIPSVHVDYLFMRDQPGAELVPVARAHDDITKTYKTHIVPMKGNIETVADELSRDLEDIGRGGNTDFTVKCDQEDSLTDLMKEIKRRKTGSTKIEHSKVSGLAVKRGSRASGSERGRDWQDA